MPFIVATYVYASSQGQRTHSARTNSSQLGRQSGQSNGRKQYCHYFVNQGKCLFEERTGEKCRFAHEQAPMCNNGFSCNRSKCMYNHPNIGGSRNMNMNFLDRTGGLQQNLNPWQMMSPWINPNQFQQFQNQWNMGSNQNSQ